MLANRLQGAVRAEPGLEIRQIETLDKKNKKTIEELSSKLWGQLSKSLSLSLYRSRHEIERRRGTPHVSANRTNRGSWPTAICRWITRRTPLYRDPDRTGHTTVEHDESLETAAVIFLPARWSSAMLAIFIISIQKSSG